MPKLLPESHVHELACPGLHRKDIPVGEKKWLCQHPDCFATFKRELIVGKRSMCTICHVNDLILTKRNLKMAFPRCNECSEREDVKRQKVVVGVAKDIMDDLLEKEDKPKQEEEQQNEAQ